MRRILYSPKSFVFVRSSNMGGKIFDVSSDVVRGSVTQNTGDVSKATFYLKNRYQKWIRDATSKQQIFLPMDLVTIWLQRIAGKPVQVFTGYLDSVPYYQAYSGDAMFEATCTLKKLAFTWFDPGLPFFQQWMMSQDGWAYDVTSGEGFRPAAIRGQSVGPGMSPGTATGQQANINDGGFADLVGRFMTEIAGWSADDVLIDGLPANIPKKAAQLFNDIQNDVDGDLSNFSTFMGQVLGVNGWSGGSGQTTAGNSAVQATGAINLVKGIAAEASSANVPTLVCVFAAEMLSNLVPTRDVPEGTTQGNDWGFGLYSLRPDTTTTGIGVSASTPEGAFVGPTIQGYNLSQILDPATATKVFCKLLNQNLGDWATRAKQGDTGSMVTWIEKAIGRSIPSSVDQTTALKTAKQLSASQSTVSPKTSPSVTIDPSTITFGDPNVQSLLTQPSEKEAYKQYSGSDQWLAAILVRAKNVSSNLRLAAFKNKVNTEIDITGSAADLKAFWTSLKGDTSLDIAQLKSGNQFTVYYQGTLSTRTTAAVPTTTDSVIVIQSSPPLKGSITISGGTTTTTPGGAGSTSTATPVATSAVTSDPTQQGGANFLQLAAFSANAAFAANFSFPADYLLATFLTGERALMNDYSCLDAVKQFCQASLRDFRSLPDGRFLAFYPDYFGSTRDPYWSIKNIEIIDFGIQLNDEALATHVYVVGDTGYPDGQIDELDQISTRGVATLMQASILSSFIEPMNSTPLPQGEQLIGRLADAEAFLLHYGARPHMEEQPIIRNTYYEFLMAWQRFMMLWASQFATTATFTFQPEVMAGGLIAFPDHNIQMYCSSVTHDWDYASGFTTTATLASPSLLKSATVADRKQYPGFALGGNANTVGAVSD